PDSVFSREHWIGYRMNDDWSVRAGRLVPPFGLRIPDHTEYTREDLDLAQWGQSYGVEIDRYSEQWGWSFGGFGGDFILDPTEIQKRGAATSLTYNWTSRATLGTSLLGWISEEVGRFAGSVFTRVKAWKATYVMAEVSPYHTWGRD